MTMTTASTFTTQLSLQELRDSQSIYLKALQLLVQDGASISEAQDSVCWKRLQRLNQAMPLQFLHPETLYQRMAPAPAKTKRRSRAKAAANK